jgi:hypothetical protein
LGVAQIKQIAASFSRRAFSGYVICTLSQRILFRLPSEYLKMKGFQSYEKLCFLVSCRLTDLKQDIGVRQFESNTLIKACGLGVSI